jgi:hypothetical protein
VIASPTFTQADMGAAARTARACDLMYNQGKAVPWFALLLEALAMTPSGLFVRFADFLDTHIDPDITALQVAFFSPCFPDAAVAGVAADIVTYFGRSGALLEAMALDPSDTHSCLATFHHDPMVLLEHLEAGLTGLEHLAEVLPKQACQARLFVEEGEVHLQILDTEETRFE